MKAAIIVIGNEVLSGETLDSNSQFLGQQLFKIGIPVVKKISVPDEAAFIKDAIPECFSVADVVICSGGLGPTSDDITKKTLAEYFESELVFDEKVFENIREILKHHYKKFSEVHRNQAFIPDKATVLPNLMGTASGLLFTKNDKILIALPGVPFELQYICLNHVIPYLLSMKTRSSILNKNIKTIGIGESVISEMIKDIEDKLPAGIKLAYLPSIGQVKLRLTAFSDINPDADELLQITTESISERLSAYIYGYDDDQIAGVIGQLLRDKNKTLAIAESCTGGYLSHLITSEAGSSDYFKGSLIAYSNEIKIKELNVPERIINQYGAVSRECAEAMAKGIREKVNSDYGIATTGIAGPGGGSADKPVGLVWIAVATSEGIESRDIIFDRGRLQNIHFSAVTALNLLRKKIRA